MPYGFQKSMLLSGVAGATTTARGGRRRGRGGYGSGLISRFVRFGIAGRGLFLIIGLIEARALKDHAAPAADQAHQFLLAALGAFLELGLDHGLQGFKAMLAAFAFVFVGWHKPPSLPAGRQA